jgi:hypothetical protein
VLTVLAIDKAPKGDTDEDLPLQSAALGASCVVDYLKRATDDHGNKLPRELVVCVAKSHVPQTRC